jgi:hypothetical protein
MFIMQPLWIKIARLQVSSACFQRPGSSMASYLLAADENDNDMKADNWDDGMYDCDATVATPGPRSHGQEAASGMKETQATHQLAVNSQAAWADWMRPEPGSSNDQSKARASKAHQGGALNAAKALQEQDAANHAKEAATKMLMTAAKQAALTRLTGKHLQEQIEKDTRQNKRAASIVQKKIASTSQGSPASGNGASTPPMSPMPVRQLFRSPGTDGQQWLSPSAAGSGTQTPMKKRPASKKKNAQEVDDKELPLKKKKKVDKVQEEESQEGEESEEEHEEDEESQEGEESEEEIVPKAAGKTTEKEKVTEKSSDKKKRQRRQCVGRKTHLLAIGRLKAKTTWNCSISRSKISGLVRQRSI